MANEEKISGLHFDRHYTREGVSPFDMFEYDYRTSVIKNPTGEVIFEMNNVEVPRGWSQIATDILAQKYFRKAGVPMPDGTLGSESSVKQVVHRMADCWRGWGQRYGYFASKQDAQVFYDEIVYCMLNQACTPNSPQWFNTGLFSSYNIVGKAQGHYFVDPSTGKLTRSSSAYEHPQPHACFILNVKDDLVGEGGIMDLWVREARIFKYGSGVGTNFSSIRGAGERLSGGGTSSGLMSFLKIGDRAAGAIKSGGTTRRAAKMVCLDLDHPEIEEFIDWKMQEENKVAALIREGYDGSFEGEAYMTVSGQNSNNSIRIPNLFFEKLEKKENWDLTARTDGHVMKSIPATKIWKSIAKAAWSCADPGVQFDTTINDWHTCPKGGRINASNPCSEYMFLDNTACNLASINLGKFFSESDSSFDVDGLQYISRLWTVVLEISVLMAQFPSKEVAQLSYDYRTLGLGFANLGAVLMLSGVPYDSNQARGIAAAITAIITGTAYKTSAEMASFLGAFPKFQENREDMLRVIRNHRAAAYDAEDAYEGLHIKPQGIQASDCPLPLLNAATQSWDDALKLGETYGYRNAQTTVIAPTGTIGLVMDCDTTGVEPDFALVKFKKLSGGGYFKIINQAVPGALKKLGYKDPEIEAITRYAVGSASFDGAPFVNSKVLKEKGFTDKEIKILNDNAASAFDIGFLFNQYLLGTECLERLGFPASAYNKPNFNLLSALGFSAEQLEAANDYVCGTMTVEGAPYLKEKDLAVFDCANRCGKKGRRYIHAHGHIRMMAACQPFLSGAISKTINLPNEATQEEIANAYQLSWEMGLKACALYRDGSKHSQPLSNKADDKDDKDEEEEVTTQAKSSQASPSIVAPASEASTIPDLSKVPVKELLEELQLRMSASPDTSLKRELSKIVKRKSLPAKRRGFTQKARVGGQVIFLRTGEYTDGTLGEIFIDLAKEGSTLRSLMNCFAIAISVGLQYGVPLEEFVEKFIFMKFEPAGMVDHPNIKTTTSLVDFVFRLLAYEYLHRTDLVHVPDPEDLHKLDPSEHSVAAVPSLPTYNVNTVKETQFSVSTSYASDRPEVESPSESKEDLELKMVNLAAKDMQSDAPVCNVCGHITVRSGTCYKCLNCGNSMGCS